MRFIQKFVFFVFLVSGSVSKAEVYDVSTTAELREALASAAAAGGDNTIRLAAGTYSTQDDGEGTFEFSTQLQGSLIITSLESDEVILDGGAVNGIFKFNFPESKPFGTLQLENLRLSNTPTTDVSYDGGLYVENSEQIVLRNIFFDEHRYIALHVRGLDGALTIENSTFQSNRAAIYAEAFGGTSLVNGSTFSLNGPSNIVMFARQSDSTVQNSSFLSNESDLYSALVRQSGVISDNSFTNNAGMLINSGGYPDPRDVYVSHNTFEGNVCGDGVTSNCYLQGGRGNVYVSNNIILNTAETSVSTLLSVGYGDDTVFSNNLILNASLDAGAVKNISNNIFLGTAAIAGGNDIISINNNYLDEDGLDSVFYEGANNIFDGINLGFVNAEQGDYRLTSSSGLIDAGTTEPELAYITDYDYTGTTGRVIGASVDIGPYEYDGEAPPDSDGDGLSDNIDNCPSIANEDQADFDSDGEGDACDSDDDNDGTNDEDDAFPFDDTESLDTDGDGIGNNEDYDDDADGILDSFDNAPLVVNAIVVDSDNDGVIDSVDAYPNDSTKQYSGSDDLDGDGWSNDDEVDYCTNPFDKNSQPDVGGLSAWMLYLGTQQEDTQ